MVVFAVVVALAVAGITALVFATRPQPLETTASGATTTPPINSTRPSSPSSTPSSALSSTTTRPRSTTTEPPSGSTTTAGRPTTTTTTTRTGPSTGGWVSYSPPGGEYTVEFPGRHQSLTQQLNGTLGNDPSIKVTDVEGTLGLATYIAILAEIPAPLTPVQLEQTAKTLQGSGGGRVGDLRRVTVSGHPAVRFTLTQDDQIEFDVVIVTSGTTMVVLMGGNVGGGPIEFDRFVESLELK